MPDARLVLSVAVLLLASVVTVASGDPPRPGETNSTLSESEEATLWSRPPADASLSNDEYRETYGENRTTIHEVANGTDLTFTTPPSTASRWTRYAHGEFEPGDRNASRYPPSAKTTDGAIIKDAHASIFAVSPSTKAHLRPGDVRYYVSTEGAVLGIIDYRLAVPSFRALNVSGGGLRVASHEIAETRLYADDERLATGPGSHRPALDYTTDEGSTLTLEADIEVTLVWGSDTGAAAENATGNDSGGATMTETVTVSDQVAVDLYDLRAALHFADYPNGDTGASIYQTEPWQGYTLDDTGTARVRGVWRFFTARNPAWDTLVESSQTETRRTASDVLPVFVHAYPSKLGPRAKPEYAGPTIIRTWGEQQASPRDALPENVTVDVVNASYVPTYGLAVRSRAFDPDAVTVRGIVYGTEADLITQLAGNRSLRESDLSADIVAENGTGITVLLRLEDAETGDPIVLADDDRIAPLANLEREGYIEIDGQRVKTNATGEAVVHLTEQGLYTARYEPASWLDSYPVYAGDSATVRWHALWGLTGWLNLFTRTVAVLSPFLLLWYAGYRLGTFLRWRRFP
jgi:hypothetical protein